MKDGKAVIGIIGLGLMGGSFGRALVKNGYTVYAYDISEDVMLKGSLMSAYSAPLTEKTAKKADILVAAIEPRYFEKAVSKFLPLLKTGAIVTDFCGVKREIIKTMRKFAAEFPELTFIGGHPMAGREFSGVEHSSINLFEKASMILVPVNADIFAVDAVKKFYLSLGFSKVVITDEKTHDEIIAYTSQLCHIVSNAFIKNRVAEKRAGFSAGSFRDLTRVAKLNPDMWTDLILSNRDNALNELSEFIDNLSEYKKALENGDKERLKKLFADGNDRKIKIETESKNV